MRFCPGLRVLATSREALGITGEVAWPVPSLSLPDLRRMPDTDSLPRYERPASSWSGRGGQTGLRAHRDNATAVAQVCYRLDGIPLAIELAAARTKVLSVEEIADRLEDSFGLLSAGGRTAMPRQHTLHATMDWSHGLLSERSVPCSAGFRFSPVVSRFEAAESVCIGEDVERDEVLGLLSHLVDKSLVVAREEGGETRYRLLETVRQYGTGEARGVRRRRPRSGGVTRDTAWGSRSEAERELEGPDQVRGG